MDVRKIITDLIVLFCFLLRLAVLTQRGEISLADKPKKPETAPPTPATSKGKRERQTRIKALSPKVKRDELLEVSVKHIQA